MAYKRKDKFAAHFPYGRRPALYDDSVEMFEQDTTLAREARGEVFDHSDLRRPALHKDYHRMEGDYPEPQFSFNNPDIVRQFPSGERGVFLWSCKCLGEFGRPAELRYEIDCNGAIFDVILPEGAGEPFVYSDCPGDKIYVDTCSAKGVYYTGKDVTDEVIRNGDASFWAAVRSGKLPDPKLVRYICDKAKDCTVCTVTIIPDCTGSCCAERNIYFVYYGGTEIVKLVPESGACGCSSYAVNYTDQFSLSLDSSRWSTSVGGSGTATQSASIFTLDAPNFGDEAMLVAKDALDPTVQEVLYEVRCKYTTTYADGQDFPFQITDKSSEPIVGAYGAYVIWAVIQWEGLRSRDEFEFSYYDSSSVHKYWNGSAWTTSNVTSGIPFTSGVYSTIQFNSDGTDWWLVVDGNTTTKVAWVDTIARSNSWWVSHLAGNISLSASVNLILDYVTYEQCST